MCFVRRVHFGPRVGVNSLAARRGSGSRASSFYHHHNRMLFHCNNRTWTLWILPLRSQGSFTFIRRLYSFCIQLTSSADTSDYSTSVHRNNKRKECLCHAALYLIVRSCTLSPPHAHRTFFDCSTRICYYIPSALMHLLSCQSFLTLLKQRPASFFAIYSLKKTSLTVHFITKYPWSLIVCDSS